MFESYGLWELIHDEVHPMELDEITKAIGRKRLDENQLLWRELHALKEIYKEVHMINTNFNTLNLHSNSSSIGSKASKDNKVPSLSSSKPRSLNNHNNGIRYVKKKSNKKEEFCAEDLFDEIRSSLTVADIHMVLSKILCGLNQESIELEEEIKLLQGNVDEEVELVSPINSQRSDYSAGNNNASNNHHNDYNSNSNNDDENELEISSFSGSNNHRKVKDPLGIEGDGYLNIDNLSERERGMDHRDVKMKNWSNSNKNKTTIKAPGAPRITTSSSTPSLFNKDQELQSYVAAQEETHQSSKPMSRIRPKSKVRSHLQEARDMKHWLEEDDGYI